MGLLFAERDHNNCWTFAWSHESTSRSTDQRIQELQQLETQAQDILSDCDLNGTGRNISICEQNEHQGTSICELEAGSRSLGDGCHEITIGPSSSICVPSIPLLGRALAKVWQDQAKLTLVTPTWQTRLWYAELLERSIADPILLLPLPDLLTSPTGQAHPLLKRGLRLASWKISRSSSGPCGQDSRFPYWNVC